MVASKPGIGSQFRYISSIHQWTFFACINHTSAARTIDWINSTKFLRLRFTWKAQQSGLEESIWRKGIYLITLLSSWNNIEISKILNGSTNFRSDIFWPAECLIIFARISHGVQAAIITIGPVYCFSWKCCANLIGRFEVWRIDWTDIVPWSFSIWPRQRTNQIKSRYANTMLSWSVSVKTIRIA
jgi:hypothetical protein